MNPLLSALQLHVPGPLRDRGMADLFRCTAGAFGCDVPPLDGLSHRQRLRLYAQFTRDQAERALAREPDAAALKDRLFQGAFLLGGGLRERLRIATLQEALAAGRILYRLLEIDFRGTGQGEIAIDRCLFSRYYSNHVCQVISSLDEGLLAGLSGGGRLVFTQRITEGHACCRAVLNLPKDGVAGRTAR